MKNNINLRFMVHLLELLFLLKDQKIKGMLKSFVDVDAQ